MGFDAKSLSEPLGMLRLGAIICLCLGNLIGMQCSAGTYGNYLWLFVFGEVVFLILGCVGVADNEIVKLIDKIYHLAAAVLVLFYVIMWLLAKVQTSGGFGNTDIKCLLGIILQTAVGCIFGAIVSQIWS